MHEVERPEVSEGRLGVQDIVERDAVCVFRGREVFDGVKMGWR